MIRTCSNCLNAYNCSALGKVCCYNLEFDAQFDESVCTIVHATDSCTRWSQRKEEQQKLNFHMAIQLDLFNEPIYPIKSMSTQPTTPARPIEDTKPTQSRHQADSTWTHQRHQADPSWTNQRHQPDPSTTPSRPILDKSTTPARPINDTKPTHQRHQAE